MPNRVRLEVIIENDDDVDWVQTMDYVEDFATALQARVVFKDAMDDLKEIAKWFRENMGKVGV